MGDGTLTDATGRDPQTELAATAAPKIDLGLNGQMFRSHFRDQSSKTPTRRDVGAELERKLNASIVDDDVQRGHARGNVLIGSLNSAVQTAGPTSGDAVIRVTLNSQGELNELELLRGAPSDWSVALQSFRQKAKIKRVLMPSGARGT